jgi:hypothetical protein
MELFKKNPSRIRIVSRVAVHHVTAGLLHSGVIKVLKNLPKFGSICWGWIRNHSLFNDPALSRISRGPSLDYVVWANSPSLRQIVKLVLSLPRTSAPRVKLLHDPIRIIEVLVDNALGTLINFSPLSGVPFAEILAARK